MFVLAHHLLKYFIFVVYINIVNQLKEIIFSISVFQITLLFPLSFKIGSLTKTLKEIKAKLFFLREIPAKLAQDRTNISNIL